MFRFRIVGNERVPFHNFLVHQLCICFRSARLAASRESAPKRRRAGGARYANVWHIISKLAVKNPSVHVITLMRTDKLALPADETLRRTLVPCTLPETLKNRAQPCSLIMQIADARTRRSCCH